MSEKREVRNKVRMIITDTDRRRLGKWLHDQTNDLDAARQEYRDLRERYGEEALIKAYRLSKCTSLSGFRKDVKLYSTLI